MVTENLGIAIDIGTTTVAAYLVGIDTGARLGAISRMNAGAAFGADVTSRIEYCTRNGHEKLTALIRGQIESMIRELCADAQNEPQTAYIPGEHFKQVVIAGNTVMQHLAAGYTPVALGVAPFTPTSLFGETLPAWESLPVSPNAEIYYAPCVSAYVGGDITAGLLAAGFDSIGKTALFIDIGTNGEIVLKHKGTYFCCAAAAGPAFEGAEITCGMAAVDGAIDHVWQGENSGKAANDTIGGLEFSVIGKKQPQGVCGSGLLDMLAVLLETGAVDNTGRLVGKDRVYLTDKDEGIFITAQDIRRLQLAKAAIAGGIQVLMRYAGITESDISLLALAGGFGSYLDPGSAARIGLFPKTLLPVVKACGNTAGEGAAMALCSDGTQERLDSIRKRCEYIELSSNAFFNEKFVEEMAFE